MANKWLLNPPERSSPLRMPIAPTAIEIHDGCRGSVRTGRNTCRGTSELGCLTVQLKIKSEIRLNSAVRGYPETLGPVHITADENRARRQTAESMLPVSCILSGYDVELGSCLRKVSRTTWATTRFALSEQSGSS